MPLKNMEDAMHEFKEGSLHSGKGGPVVKNRKQAIAIGLSAKDRFQKKGKKKKGKPMFAKDQAAALKGKC